MANDSNIGQPLLKSMERYFHNCYRISNFVLRSCAIAAIGSAKCLWPGPKDRVLNHGIKAGAWALDSMQPFV